MLETQHGSVYPILAEPLRIEKGMAIIDDAVGSGVEWNEDAVRRYSV
jgi:mandelate racemase